MFSSAPVVKVKNANIIQGQRVVLSNVNFEIGKGEFVFLVGRTGSGKSSLLKTLYADIPTTEGEIEVVGFNLAGIKAKQIPMLRRKIGVIFQDFQLFPDRNVVENLMFLTKALGWGNSVKSKRRIVDVLMQVGLSSADKKMPHQLSGGEQQRVVIARALLNEPQILFADEPTGNLDPEVSIEILKLFQNINENGTSVLMGTHSYHLIEKFPNRILQCENGKVIDSLNGNIELS